MVRSGRRRARGCVLLTPTLSPQAGRGRRRNRNASPPMSLQLYLAYVAACIGLALLPGPIVTLVIANGLRHGTRSALTNIAGVQAAMTIVIGIVAIGLTSL